MDSSEFSWWMRKVTTLLEEILEELKKANGEPEPGASSVESEDEQEEARLSKVVWGGVSDE